MEARAVIWWGAAAVASLVMTVATARVAGRPRAPRPESPAALPRPASAAERAAVEDALTQLREDLGAATERLGSPPALHELESTAADGRPVLAHGLPDNPLAPTVAGVQARCPATPEPGDSMDWIYCEASGDIAAVGLEDTVIGKE